MNRVALSSVSFESIDGFVSRFDYIVAVKARGDGRRATSL